MTIHMVHSFKGGCGKTTAALLLAAELSQEDKKRKVILVDMDLKGSGLEATLYQGVTLENDNDVYSAALKWQGHYFVDENARIRIRKSKMDLTDYFANWHYQDNSISPGDCIQKLDFVTFSIDAMVASMEQRKKRKLYIGVGSGGIQLDLFRYRFENLLIYLDAHQYTDVVLDMPPSSDEYVEEINRVLFPANKKNIQPSIVNLYYITTTDTSNLATAGEYLHYLLFRQNSSMQRSSPDQIIIVLNDLYNQIGSYFDPNTSIDTGFLYKMINNPSSRQASSEVRNIFNQLSNAIYNGAVNMSETSDANQLFFTFMPYNKLLQNEMSSYLQSNRTFLSLDALRNKPYVDDSANPSDPFKWGNSTAPSIIPAPIIGENNRAKDAGNKHDEQHPEAFLLQSYINLKMVGEGK